MIDEGKSLFQQGYDDAVAGRDRASDDEDYLAGYIVGLVELEQRRAGGWPREFFWRRVGQLAAELGLPASWFKDHVPPEFWEDFMEGYNGPDDEEQEDDDDH